MNSLFFYLLGIFNLIFILILINAKNPIHRIAALVLIFLTGSFIFMLLDVYFLGLAYIIVYVGAIAILFLFVIMLIEHPSVGYNYEINNIIRNHKSIISNNIYIKDIDNISKINNKELIIIKKNKDKKIYLNIQDIILSYNKVGNIFNSEFKNNLFYNFYFFITLKKEGYIKNGEDLIIKIFSIILGVIIIYIHYYEDFINIISNIFYNKDNNIYNYFYIIWSIDYLSITDIEIFGYNIYTAYPIALIYISIALWAVMIGIISICSPRVLY